MDGESQKSINVIWRKFVGAMKGGKQIADGRKSEAVGALNDVWRFVGGI
jgi:hypothetical protein